MVYSAVGREWRHWWMGSTGVWVPLVDGFYWWMGSNGGFVPLVEGFHYGTDLLVVGFQWWMFSASGSVPVVDEFHWPLSTRELFFLALANGPHCP